MTPGILICLIVMSILPSGLLLAQQQKGTNKGAALFEKQCYSCHNIGGGDKTGPDLRGVTSRRTREWLHNFIKSPTAMKNSGDATAKELFAKFAPTVMPDQTLSSAEVDAILSFIEQLTTRGQSFAPGGGQALPKATDKDVLLGKYLFTGKRRLKNGGPPCISCHSIEGTGALGGGTLAPDLTNVNIRFNDAELVSLLRSMSTRTMSKVYAGRGLTEGELKQIFGYLQRVRNRQSVPLRAGGRLVALGSAGTVLLFVLLNLLWQSRLPSGRERLLHRQPAEEGERGVVNGALVRAHAYVALSGILLPLLGALLMAAKFVWPDLLGEIVPLQLGRLRVFHTNGVIYGWLGLSFLALLNYTVPKLANRPLLSEPLAWWTLRMWTLALIVGLTAVLGGEMEGVEYAEFPWYADILFAIAFLMAVVNYLGTIFTSPEKQLYVSSWYFILGLAFTTLNYVMANTIVAHVAPGAAGAALAGLWIHNAVGLFVTPLGVGLVYYFLPVMIRKPLYSHLLSLVGFWTLALFYPLGGAHHYFFSPIPWWVQVLAVPLTVILFIVVVTVVYNWLMTLSGNWAEVPKSPALTFMVTGIFAYMATCSQGPFQTFLTIQKVTHFTDWIIGHAHLALFGTFTYWNIGALLYVWPKVTGREFYSTKLNWSAYWLMTISFYLFYFFPLTALGLVEGFSWMSGSPFSVPILAAKPMWLFRFIGGAGMYLGFLLLAYNFWQTAHRGEPITPTPHPSSWQEQSRT